MIFAQRLDRLSTLLSEYIPVVKRRMSVHEDDGEDVRQTGYR
jgi:hypothetical protein